MEAFQRYILPMDVLLFGILLSVSVAVFFLDSHFEEVVFAVYKEYSAQSTSADPLPYSAEKLLSVMMALNGMILYFLFRLREHEQRNLEKDLAEQQEYEELFHMETEFMQELANHGILLEMPPGSGSAE
ncbi:hypothetical protein KR018_001316, partial [Drosophila ironensis]